MTINKLQSRKRSTTAVNQLVRQPSPAKAKTLTDEGRSRPIPGSGTRLSDTDTASAAPLVAQLNLADEIHN